MDRELMTPNGSRSLWRLSRSAPLRGALFAIRGIEHGAGKQRESPIPDRNEAWFVGWKLMEY